MVLSGILFYLIAQLGLGVWISRRVASVNDYLLAGRSLGPWLATFSLFATWFGAESCLGTAGQAYEHGLAGVHADPFGYGICLLLLGLFFAAPLWNRKLTTVADFFSQRFSPGTARIAALLMIPTSLLWAGAQIRAFGQVLCAHSDFPLLATMTFAALIVILYTMSGGLWADAATDLLQGVVLIVGLGLVGALLAPEFFESWKQLPAEKKEWLATSSDSLSRWKMLEAWAIPIAGSLFAQELISRSLGSRSVSVARGSALLAGVMYLLIGLIPVGLGLLCIVKLPGLTDSEQALPILVHQTLPFSLGILFSGALLSAILSTVDSALLAASSLTTQNLCAGMMTRFSEESRLKIQRIGVGLAGAIAYAIALVSDGVYELVKEASAFGSSGIFVVMVLGLFTRLGNSWSACAALLGGVATWILGNHFWNLPYPYLTSMGVATLLYLMPLPSARAGSEASC